MMTITVPSKRVRGIYEALLRDFPDREEAVVHAIRKAAILNFQNTPKARKRARSFLLAAVRLRALL